MPSPLAFLKSLVQQSDNNFKRQALQISMQRGLTKSQTKNLAKVIAARKDENYLLAANLLPIILSDSKSAKKVKALLNG